MEAGSEAHAFWESLPPNETWKPLVKAKKWPVRDIYGRIMACDFSKFYLVAGVISCLLISFCYPQVFSETALNFVASDNLVLILP